MLKALLFLTDGVPFPVAGPTRAVQAWRQGVEFQRSGIDENPQSSVLFV
jgi:hypothetical protein